VKVFLLLLLGTLALLSISQQIDSIIVMADACTSSGTPNVTTDKQDYKNGETVFINGEGFDCGSTLTVIITWPPGDGRIDSAPVIADSNGEFTYNYQLSLDAISGAYVVNVLDADGNVLASTVFHDTHFRYGHITWTHVGGTTAEFTIQNAWRRSAYTTSNGRCVDPSFSSLPSIPCTGPGGIAGVGDVILEFQGGTQFFTGDGIVISSPRGALAYVVTSIDLTNDWLFGVAIDPNYDGLGNLDS